MAVTGPLLLALLYSVPEAPPAAPKTEAKGTPLRVLSATFGPLDDDAPGLAQGVFDFKSAKTIGRKDQYYGWAIVVECPKGVTEIDWQETTTLPAPDPLAKPGPYEDDPTITVSEDRRSFVTRRGTLCRDGTAHLDDLYGREEREPLGPWRIEVQVGTQRLAVFDYVLEAHWVADEGAK